MTNIFVIADTHFFHGNIIQYCNRPFYDYQEMNDTMIQNWNSVVGKDDLVIHLGDFAFRNKHSLVRKKLNGKIILIRGNHDRNIKEEDGFLIFENSLTLGNIIFTHVPLDSNDIPVGYKNIHGHIHHHDSYFGINVSVEQINYTPIMLSKLLQNETIND